MAYTSKGAYVQIGLFFAGILMPSSVMGEALVTAKEEAKMAGVAEMSADGSLTIRMFDAPSNALPVVVKPTDRYYDKWVKDVGGVKPGEKRFIPRSVGTVTMKEDGSITYILDAFSPSGEMHSVPGFAKAGDVTYINLLSRVGGLKPGETKAIPRD